MIKRIDLFSCPVYKTYVDPSTYNKQDILTVVADNYNRSSVRRSPDPIYPESTFHTYHGNFDNVDYEMLPIAILKEIYSKKIKDFFLSLDLKVPCQYKWYILNTHVGYNGYLQRHIHHHFDTNFSCQYVFTHYISFDKKSHSATRLINTTQARFSFDTQNFGKKMKMEEKNSIYSNSWILETDEDDMVIFPAWLEHEVTPSQTTNDDKLRVVIAGNICVKNDFVN